MTVAQELDRELSREDLKLKREAEGDIQKMLDGAANNPDIQAFLEDIQEMVEEKGEMVKKPVSKDEVRDLAVLSEFSEILSQLEDKGLDIQKLIGASNPEELEAAIKEKINSQTEEIKSLAMPILKILGIFAKNSIIETIKNAEGRLGVSLERFNKAVLSKMPEDTLDFISRLAKKNYTMPELVTLYPFLVRVLQTPGKKAKAKDTQDQMGYLEFTQDLNKVDIVVTGDTTAPTLPNMPKYGPRVTSSLKRGTMESDLVILAAVNEKLYDKVTSSLAEVGLNKKGSGRAFGCTQQEMSAKKQKMLDLGKKMASQAKKMSSGESADTAPDPISKEEMEEFEKLQKIVATNPVTPKERHEYQALWEKSQRGDATTEEERRMRIIKSKLDNELRLSDLNTRIEASGKADELQSKYANGTSSRKEINQYEYLMGSNRVALNNIVDQLTQKKETLLRKTERTKADTEDLELYDLSISFLKNCQSLSEFLTKFYNPLLEKNTQSSKKVYEQAGEALPDESTIRLEAATKTLKDIEKMIQHLVITMYTEIIEAGGEPDTDFNQAASKAFTSLGYTPRTLVQVISRALTGLKASAAIMSRGEDISHLDVDGSVSKQLATEGFIFAKAIRDQQEEYVSSSRGRQLINSTRVSYVASSGSEGLQSFTNMIEREFDVFETAIQSSYTLRFIAHKDPGKYFETLNNPQMSDFLKSDLFDVIHTMADGELVAQMLPTVKMLIMDFFNERGWIVGQELEDEAFKHRRTVYTYVADFLHKNYPDLSDTTRRKIAYLAVGQSYLRFMFQEMMSKTRPRSGFQGKLYHRDNAHFDLHNSTRMFAYSNAGDLVTHKAWARGVQVLPAWIGGDKYNVPKGRENVNQNVQNLKHTVPYGALVEYGTGEFGHFLTYTDREFDGTVTRSMLPYNIFDVGSDDKYKGWRQISKSLGNVSTALYERLPASDSIKLRTSYRDSDQLVVLWKSIENVGLNYLRTYFDPGAGGPVKLSVVEGKIKEEAKFEQLFKFLFRRYFVDNPQTALPANFRQNILAGMPEFAGCKTAEEFWSKAKEVILSDPSQASSIYDKILTRVSTIILAERNPSTFLVIQNSWITQTGENIRQYLEKKYKSAEMAYLGFSKPNGQLDLDVWDEARNDFMYVQSEARGRVTRQVKQKREKWESRSAQEKGLDKNIFGNFQEDFSDVTITGDANSKGYVITIDTVKKLLQEKYDKQKMPQVEIDKKIKRAVAIYSDTIEAMTKTPDLPDYEKLHAYYRASAKDAYKEAWSSSMTEANSEGLFQSRIGKSKEEYENRYKGKLKNRSEWFMYLWKNKFLGVEPEMDMAEDLTVYTNADEAHVSRMVGMIKNTVGFAKEKIGNPNDELSFAEQAKNFAKDPIATIDEWSKFLNPFRKTIEDELGKEPAIRFLQYYMMGIIDASLKEDEYRSGLDPKGLKGMFENVMESYFGFNKTSFITERNQYFISKSLGAMEANKVVRYLLQKKLVNPEGAKMLRVRMKATIPQIIWEVAPYAAFFLLISMAWQIRGDAQAILDGKKKK